jgi:hypothetical protein
MAAKRQPGRNASAANSGCVTVAATPTSPGVAHAAVGSVAGNTGVASGVISKAGHSAPHL